MSGNQSVQWRKWIRKLIRERMNSVLMSARVDLKVSREQTKKMLDIVEIMCPYCGEFQQTDIDASAGSQEYWQDCQVCCCPILFDLQVNADQDFQVTVRRDDE